MPDYDHADSQRRQGVIARDIASYLEDAIIALYDALDMLDGGEADDLLDAIHTAEELRDKYRTIGAVL